MASNLSYEIYCYAIALFAQSISIAIAISAYKNSGRFRYSWIVMSTVLGVMLLRRVVTLTSHTQTEISSPLEASLTVAISIGMAIAMYGLKNIFIDLEKQKTVLEGLTQTDPLTGALNRAGIMSHLEQEFQRAHRNLQPVAVLMIDIDHFKFVNDQYGHLVGDVVLQNLISNLQRSVREIDSIGRFGGEEFLVILPDTSTEQASATAERIRKAVEQSTCAYADEKEVKITISIGVAVYNPHEFDLQKSQNRLQEYIRQSDLAMYKAKNSGRNCVVLWTPELGPIQTL